MYSPAVVNSEAQWWSTEQSSTLSPLWSSAVLARALWVTFEMDEVVVHKIHLLSFLVLLTSGHLPTDFCAQTTSHSVGVLKSVPEAMHPGWEVLSLEPLGLTLHCSYGHGPYGLHPQQLPTSAPPALTLFLMLLSSLLEFHNNPAYTSLLPPSSATPFCLTGTLWGPEKPLGL